MSKNRKYQIKSSHRLRPASRRARGSRVQECWPEQRSALEQHVARHLAPAAFVIHEIESEIVHVDVHVVPPADDRAFWFLFTTGMSALPMTVPRNMGLVPHAELCMRLPKWWQMNMERWKTEPKWFWPVRELMSTARYPHRNRTWLGEGHTIARSHPACPLDPSTSLAALLLLPCVLDEAAEGTAIDASVATELLELWPLHADELEYKRTHGVTALLEQLVEAGVSDIIDPDRPSCVAPGQPTHAGEPCVVNGSQKLPARNVHLA